jgi:8-oxo-dGTP pyrophosphatase MutT (NUDIX family)
MAGRTEIGPGSPAPFLELCATGVLVAGAKVLLVHRNPTRLSYPDVWDLPGGHVQAGEESAEALVRDLTAELGIVIDRPVESGRGRLTLPDVVLDTWVLRSWQGNPVNCAPEEHDALGWFALAKIPDLRLAYPELLELCTRALAANP